MLYIIFQYGWDINRFRSDTWKYNKIVGAYRHTSELIGKINIVRIKFIYLKHFFLKINTRLKIYRNVQKFIKIGDKIKEILPFICVILRKAIFNPIVKLSEWGKLIFIKHKLI